MSQFWKINIFKKRENISKKYLKFIQTEHYKIERIRRTVATVLIIIIIKI